MCRAASASRSPATSSQSTPQSTPTPPTRRLERFDQQWGTRFPVITQAWLDAWEHVTPFLAFPPEVRRVIYTTDESVKGAGLVRGRFSGVRSVAGGSRRGADRLLGAGF